MFSFIDGFYPSFHASLKQRVVFTTRHKKVTTNPRDTIFWITDHNFFSHERFSTETGHYLRFLTQKKNYKNWGPTMSFRASKSGLGYEVQKKLEAVRLQNLYPCNIYRTVTSSLSISFITVYRQKRQCYHCMCSDLINTIIAFVRHEAMCFITLFTVFYGKLRVSSSNLSYVSAKILTSSSRKQIWKNPFKSVNVYLLEDPQKIVRFISN